ncbi:MAG: hypothetical protein ACK418_12440 [Pseudomonas sp.]|uniref:hypothetical protein n=1 Tax=Pseudomonas sp. TaxID=306 RepID=UPI00391DBCE1
MKNLQGAFSLCALARLCACSPTEQTLTFDVCHVSVHASGMKGSAVCELRE